MAGKSKGKSKDASDDTSEEIEDGAVGEDGEAGEKKKPNLIKLGLFIGLPVVILILAGTAGALLLLGGGDETHVAEGGEHGEAGEHGDGHGAPAAPVEALKYTFAEPMYVNINTSAGSSDILKIEMTFIVSDESVFPVIEAHMEEISSSYVGFLRELRTEDIVGSGGWYRLKLELLRRANLELAPARIEEVLITDLAVN